MSAAAETRPILRLDGTQRPHRRTAGRGGRLLHRPGHRHHRAAGPQRRRQDQHHQGHHRPDRPHRSRGARRRADREGADVQDHPQRRGVRARGPRGVLQAHRGGEPPARRTRRRTPAPARRGALPGPAGPVRPDGRHPLRRPAADGLAGPRAAEHQQDPARRRTHQGPGPENRRRGRRDPRRSGQDRPDPPGRAEPARRPPARRGRRRPLRRPGGPHRQRPGVPRRRRADPAPAGRLRRRPARESPPGDPPGHEAGNQPGKAPPCEHRRPAALHRPRPRRTVLPRGRRAVPDLRADGRAQLRARRLPDPRRLHRLGNRPPRPARTTGGRSCSPCWSGPRPGPPLPPSPSSS